MEREETSELDAAAVDELIENINATITDSNGQKGPLFDASETALFLAQITSLGVTSETFEGLGDRLERWAAHIDSPAKLAASKANRDLMLRMAVECSEGAFDLLLRDFWSPRIFTAQGLEGKCSRLQAAQSVITHVHAAKFFGATDALKLLYPDEDLNFPDLAPNFQEDDDIVRFLDLVSDGGGDKDDEAWRLRDEAEHRNWLRDELTALLNEVEMLMTGELSVSFDPTMNAFVSLDKSQDATALIETGAAESFIAQFHPSLRGLMRTKFGGIVRALLAPISSEEKIGQVREKFSRQVGHTAGRRFADGMTGAESKGVAGEAIFVPANEEEGFFDVMKKALMIDKDSVVDDLIVSMKLEKVEQVMAKQIHESGETMRVIGAAELTDGTQFENWTGVEMAFFSLLEDEDMRRLFTEIDPQHLTVLMVSPEGIVLTDNAEVFYEQAKASRSVHEGVFSIHRDSAEDTAGISQLAKMYKFKPEARETLAKLKLSLMSDLVIYEEVLRGEGDAGIGAGTVLREAPDRVEALNRTTFINPHSGRRIGALKTLNIFSLLEYAPRSTEENQEYQLRATLAGVSIWTIDGTRVVETIPFRGDIYRELAMTIFRHKDEDHTDISVQAMEEVVLELGKRLREKETARTTLDKKILEIEATHGVKILMDPVSTRQRDREHASLKTLLELRYPGKLNTEQVNWIAEALEAYPRELTDGLIVTAQIGEENPGRMTRTTMSYGNGSIEVLLIAGNEVPELFKFSFAHEMGHHLQRTRSDSFGEVEEIYQFEPREAAHLIAELTPVERKRMRKRLKKAGREENDIQRVLAELASNKALVHGIAQIEGGVRNFPTHYSLSGGPDEYFAEACALWVCDPAKFNEMKTDGGVLSQDYYARLEQALIEAGVQQIDLNTEDDELYQTPTSLPSDEAIFNQILVNEIGFSDEQ